MRCCTLRACVWLACSKHSKMSVDLGNLRAWIWVCEFHLFFFHSSQKQSSSLCAKCWRQRGLQIMTPSFSSIHSKMQDAIPSQGSPSQTAATPFSWGRLARTAAYCLFVYLRLWYILFCCYTCNMFLKTL